MTLIDNGTKLLSNDFNGMLHIFDLQGNLLKSFNPNDLLKNPVSLCALNHPYKQEIFVGDYELKKVFVFDSKFELKWQFEDENINNPQYMIIDNEYNCSNLYISETLDNEITIWNTRNGKFIDKMAVDSPCEINFTKNEFFVLGIILDAIIEKNKVNKIIQGGNCVFEVDKQSLEIKRKIIGDWFSPGYLNFSMNGNLHIIAYNFDENLIKSEFKYFLTIDKNGKIINKILINNTKFFHDVVLLKNNNLIISDYNRVKIFEFE